MYFSFTQSIPVGDLPQDELTTSCTIGEASENDSPLFSFRCTCFLLLYSVHIYA